MTRTLKCWIVLQDGKHPYFGWWLTRDEAIYNHSKEQKFTWAECRKDGDRCVKCTITYELPER